MLRARLRSDTVREPCYGNSLSARLFAICLTTIHWGIDIQVREVFTGWKWRGRAKRDGL